MQETTSIIVSGSGDYTLKIWDLNGNLLHTLEGHTAEVWGCSISRDGSLVVSASHDNTLRVWETHSGNCIKVIKGHLGGLRGCAIFSDSSYIVSVSYDKTVRIWDTNSGYCSNILQGHTDFVNDCAVSRDGSFIVSVSADTTIRIWDTQSGKCKQILKEHSDGVTGCAISNDGNTIVTCADDKKICVWEYGKLKKVLHGHNHWVWSCALSGDGKFIVSGSSDKTLRVWDTNTGTCMKVLKGHTDCVNRCAISSNCKYIISASKDRSVRIWETESGKCVRTLKGHTDFVHCVAISDSSPLEIKRNLNKQIWMDLQHLNRSSNDENLYTNTLNQDIWKISNQGISPKILLHYVIGSRIYYALKVNTSLSYITQISQSDQKFGLLSKTIPSIHSFDRYMEALVRNNNNQKKISSSQFLDIEFIGFWEMLAVAKWIGDIDCLGINGQNAGYLLIQEDQSKCAVVHKVNHTNFLGSGESEERIVDFPSPDIFVTPQQKIHYSSISLRDKISFLRKISEIISLTNSAIANFVQSEFSADTPLVLKDATLDVQWSMTRELQHRRNQLEVVYRSELDKFLMY